jgi:hypothetical protein
MIESNFEKRPDFGGILKHLYGEQEEAALPSAPVVSKRKPTIPRTLGNANLYAEAQRLYNPNSPQVPKAPAPGAGTAAAMDMSGRWGTNG